MQDILGESLRTFKQNRIRKTRLIAIVLVLSLVVSLDVFWALRQPGLTLAGDADCGILEHTHDEVCQAAEAPCSLAEHVHSIECYSDETADIETMLDWQEMFAQYPYTGNLPEDLVGIAQSQVGYSESLLNFEIGSDGVRRGYTRYGAWYGTPYRDWSAMFVSFCLNYAGADAGMYPGNTGASAMAELWNNLGRYAPAGTYTPLSGDLVFFTDNTVGIVTEVLQANAYVIRADVEDSVVGQILALTDPTISGWGIVGEAAQADEPLEDAELPQEEPAEEIPEETQEAVPETPAAAIPTVDKETLLDISQGPAVFLLSGSNRQMQMQTFSLRASRTIKDLLSYLNDNGGSYFFTLLDKNNRELPKDADGNYIATADTGYKLTVSFHSPEGFHPGTYQYQVPNGLLVDGGEGTFLLTDNTQVGTWTVTDTGLITLEFNDLINSHTDITISATLGIHFPEQEDPLDFDGKISVTIEKPQEDAATTKLNKWGSQGDPITNKTDTSKIYWTLQITGNKDSSIPGSVLTDQVLEYDWSYPHHYTQSDIDQGLSFGASVVIPGEELEQTWHQWTVSPDDPNLTWVETGWSYTIPETVYCEACRSEITLGSNYWTYYVDYTSTPDATNVAGGLPYANRVEVDGQQAEGWARYTQNQIHADVNKNGTFVSDAGGGRFLWEVQVTLPGRKADERAIANWIVHDEMDILDSNYAVLGYVTNDINKATVTANYYGKTIQVPRIQDATENDPYVWMVSDWSGSVNGIYNTRQIYLLQRCNCTAESCAYGGNCWTWGYTGNDGYWVNSSDYCPCWTETEDTTFTFTYTTNDVDTIGVYGGQDNQLRNRVTLMHENAPDIARTHATVPIPSMLDKVLTKDFDGYVAKYNVTVNESKLMLTDGSPLTIRDTMTDTLAYISGSLVITTEDAAGNRGTLQQGVDYIVTYDGTGNIKDENNKSVHVMEIEILHPQPVMYILDYDTTLIVPDKVTEGIKYGNSAAITLWGDSITDTSADKVYADINIAAKSYKVDLFKTCADTGEPLGGATFGLYNESGGLITKEVTDANGKLNFQTNITEGIILREHILYYMQELQAPTGYKLDSTQYWFCFCDKAADTCETCDQVLAGRDAARIPLEKIGIINITNELMGYELPGTGGPGIYPLILVSVIFIVTPLVYGFILRRKRERRGVG